MYNGRNYIEFTTLEHFADWLGYEFPEEIHIVAACEGWKNDDGELDKDAINDTLRRMNISERVTHVKGSIIVE